MTGKSMEEWLTRENHMKNNSNQNAQLKNHIQATSHCTRERGSTKERHPHKATTTAGKSFKTGGNSNHNNKAIKQ